MERPSSASKPVAVVGMACRLPGANDVAQCWELVRDGKCMVRPLPPERFDRDLLYHREKGRLGSSYTDLACLVDYDYRRSTDPIRMPDTPEVAYATMAQVAAEAGLDASIDGSRPHNGGVYIGHVRASDLAGDIAYANYLPQVAALLRDLPGFRNLTGSHGEAIIQELVDDARRKYPCRQANGGPALAANVPALLVAEGLRFNGRSMAFNSACASSLQALVQAVRALQLGQIEIAVAGGASYCHSDTLVMFSRAQSVSAIESRPFDVDADGLIVGEGYVALVLKSLDRALQDKDNIHAVIRGLGISSDGRGKSLWAPRGEGQIRAIRRAYESGLDPARLQYIEAHATSTQVGDATELAALAKALDGKLPSGARIPVGSIKANIGHTLETAGLAGLLKVILALKHGVIPPAINIDRLNPKIDWKTVPFHVPRSIAKWPKWSDGHPRRAAVNAFGIGGLNVHVVVDEFQPATKYDAYRAPRIGLQSATRSMTSDLGAPPDIPDGVAVIGMGAVLPGALNIEAFSDLLQSGRSSIRDVPADRWDLSRYYQPGEPQSWHSVAKTGGFITDFEYDWRKHKIPPKQIAQASPLQFMILDAVDQAFRQANIDCKALDRRRTGVVVGSPFGGQFSLKLMMGLRLPELRCSLRAVLLRYGAAERAVDAVLDQYQQRFLEAFPALLDETGSFTTSSLASRITKSFDLMGGGVAVDAGTVTSGAALSCCVDQILSGDCDHMVCVAGQQDMSPIQYEIWGLRGLLTSSEPRSPFDAQASGCIPAEGCAVLLLKQLSAARKDRNPILGIIRGIGAAQAGALEENVRLASCRALQQSGLQPRDVTVVESCSFGTATSAAKEICGLDAAYSSRGSGEPMVLGSLVGQIGHLAAAAGMASALKAMMALEARQMPGTQGFREPADFVRQSTAKMQVSAQPCPIPVTHPDGRVLAAVNCCDAGNSAFHILIERGTKVERPQQPAGSRDPSARSASGVEVIEGILHFDATLRRKESLRKTVAGEGKQPTVPLEHERSQDMVEIPLPSPAPSILVPSSRDSAVAPCKVPTADEIENFLIAFVVDETGYPEDMVEMDADLEADLGIDSIKKAQMLAELRDRFQLTIELNYDLSLDEFPTLQHISDFILSETTEGFVVSPETVEADSMRTARTPLGRDQIPETAAVAPTRELAVPVATASPPKEKELAEFMIQFVVDETGYPDEMVELDADLEADLGIDSIKKAQLLGELRDHFKLPIRPHDDMSLDDFPTLLHILRYIVQACSDKSETTTVDDNIIAPLTTFPASANQMQDYVN